MDISNIPPNISGIIKKSKLEIGPNAFFSHLISHTATPFNITSPIDFARYWNPTKEFTGNLPFFIEKGISSMNTIQVFNLVGAIRPSEYGGHFPPENLLLFSVKGEERRYLLDIVTLNCMLACEPYFNSIQNEKEIKKKVTLMGIAQGGTIEENHNVYLGHQAVDVNSYTSISVMMLGRGPVKNYWGENIETSQILGFELKKELVKGKSYRLSKKRTMNCKHDGYAFQITPKLASSKYGDPLKDRKYEVNGETRYSKFIYAGVAEQRFNYLPWKMDVTDYISQVESPLIIINVARKTGGC
jgi:hypothetical protein